jgi:molybdopterin converting factor small subunit
VRPADTHTPSLSHEPSSNAPKPPGMRIEVLLFAAPKEVLGGKASVHVDVVVAPLASPAPPPPSSSSSSSPAAAVTVADVRRALGDAYPELGPFLPSCRFAVNQEFADDEAGTAVAEGAEVALIPPVSGG